MRRWVLVAAAIGALLWWWYRPVGPDVPGGEAIVDAAPERQRPGGGFSSGRAPGRAQRDVDAVPVSAGGRPLVADPKREANPDSGGLEIVVRDADDARPLAEALVSVAPIGGDERTQLLTDADGRALPSLMPGEYQVVVEREGYLTRTLRLGMPASGAPVRREVSLRAVVGVEGIVLDQDGSPVPGASVSFTSTGEGGSRFNRNVTSDSEGLFTIEVSPSTTYRVRASKSPHPRTELRDVEVGPAGRAPLELRMNLRQDTVRLTGTVVNDENEGVEGATVRLRYRSSGRRRTLATGRSRAGGRFEIELLPRSRLELTASASGYRTETQRNVSIRKDTHLNLKLAAYDAFEVHVVDTEGRTVENARIHGVDQRGRRILRERPDGRYFASRYPVRIYADALDRNLGVSDEVLVESYRPAVELVLQPGCRLNGRVARDDGTPVTSFVVSIQQPGLASVSRRIYAEDGSFQLEGLPHGDVTVSVSASGLQRHRQQLTLDPGRPSWLEVVLDPRQRRQRSGQ